jgi:hypothetical protein
MSRLTAPCFLKPLPLALAASASLILASEAQIVTLQDVNSVAHVDTTQGAGNGMTDWSVGGQNQLAQQWFWYRTSSGALQKSIDTISAPTIVQPDAADMTVTYANATFSLSISYSMSGTTPGSGNADIQESIHIHNNTASPLNFTFFQYSDFDLGGNPNGDSVSIHPNGSGGYDSATQTKLATQISETVITPPANRAEANTWPNTLNSLINTPGYNLNNVTSAGPGDVTWAYQWDFTSIAANGDQDILKDKILSISPIPEPSVIALGIAGLTAFALRRRVRA